MIITTVLQTLIDRLDLGRTLPQAIASPRASQRNGDDHARRAGVHRLAGGPARCRADRTAHDIDPTGEIGAVTGIEFLPGNRFLSAAEPTRRGGGSAMVVAP